MTTKLHHLKSWPQFFHALSTGTRTHELRQNDRGYNVGDILVLEEYDKESGYTGGSCSFLVTSITSDDQPCAVSKEGITAGYCIMSVKLLDAAQQPAPTASQQG